PPARAGRSPIRTRRAGTTRSASSSPRSKPSWRAKVPLTRSKKKTPVRRRAGTTTTPSDASIPARMIWLPAAVACLAATAHADDYDNLGSLERIEVDTVLAERGLALDRAPDGKKVRDVIIATRPVFSDSDGFLTWFNNFHWTTREEIIRREILFGPGDPWN